jgi:hypothetical protein
MNERIKELYQQAHMVREYPADDPMRGGNPPTIYWGDERSAEKFAELIVRECALLADKAEPYKANDLILKHFGVE